MNSVTQVPVRKVTLRITDGADAHSTRAQASHVAALANDVLASENHIIAAMGIADGSTDFCRTLRDMGVPEEWILTPGNTAGEVPAKSVSRRDYSNPRISLATSSSERARKSSWRARSK